MQKTAYDLRISDWSSDVCSSDLLVERLGGGDEHRFGVAILHALRIAIGGEAHRGAIRAGDGGDSFDDLEQQAKAVLGAAAVAIGAEIGAVAQELVDQIAVRGVELDTVEPGGKRVSRRPAVLVEQAGDFGDVGRARPGLSLPGPHGMAHT